MKLSSNQAAETILNPQSAKEIDSVKKQESQMRVFTEELDKDELCKESYWTELQEKMKARSAKKFDRVFQFARYPLPVAQVTDSILSDYFKVFDGKNKNFRVNGDRDLTLLNQWIEETHPEDWIENHATEVFKNKPCSFVVVDKDDKGIPYLIYIDSSRLIDAQFKGMKNRMEYISFIHSTEKSGDKIITRYAVYDDVHYRVFERFEGTSNVTLIKEVEHFIGYTPAIPFVSKSANKQNLFKRRVAFSKSLSKLEDWTIFDIFRNYVDHYAPFPVTEAPIKKCPNPRCEKGHISEIIDDPRKPGSTKTTYTKCDICAKREGNLIYPGTHIGIQVKSDSSLNDGSGVFKMIFPDTDKMKYVPEKLDDLELEIRHKTVGLNYMQSSNEAMNEMQLKGSFASMESVLLRTKKELDILYIWIVKTVAKTYYKDIDVKVDANFGTEYYLISETELQERIDKAKKIGLPNDEIVSLYKQLIQTKYSGNQMKIKRHMMLIDIDDFPMQSIDECVKMKNESVIDAFDLSLKANMTNLIGKFERENIDIVQFGLNLDYAQRIDVIKKTLILYNQELIKEKNERNNPVKQPGETVEKVVKF